MNDRTEKGINSFQLKCWGLIFMTADHIGQYICNTININPLRIIGRIAAPLFLYVTVNSISHTRNKLKYALRLYLAHILICLMTLLLTTVGKNQFGNNNQFSILATFVYVVILVCIVEKIIKSPKKITINNFLLFLLAIAIIIIPTVILFLFSRFEILYQIFLPSILTVPYSPLFILMGICWYFTKDKAKQGFVLIFFSCLSFAGAQLIARLNAWIFIDFFNNIQFCMILFLPFIFLYNGKKGKSMKYFFYIYYPVHVYILMLIGQYLI